MADAGPPGAGAAGPGLDEATRREKLAQVQAALKGINERIQGQRGFSGGKRARGAGSSAAASGGDAGSRAADAPSAKGKRPRSPSSSSSSDEVTITSTANTEVIITQASVRGPGRCRPRRGRRAPQAAAQKKFAAARSCRGRRRRI
ncbi:unnamed protein product [Prorocentrum cordatum]|nr:unnamed protein product [Polarella glacialis]